MNKIKPKLPNSWQSCDLCSATCDTVYLTVHNSTTDSHFNVCSPCMDSMNTALRVGKDAHDLSKDLLIEFLQLQAQLVSLQDYLGSQCETVSEAVQTQEEIEVLETKLTNINNQIQELT